jgi:protein-S-isoprenylcysteine O-methyltransferase Ste14
MLKERHFIDAHKALTAPVVLAMIFFYQAQANVLAWIYLALHGSYGIMWFTKSMVFPDKSWERPVSIVKGMGMWLGLLLYWVTPWLIVSGRAHAMPLWWLTVCISLYSVGVFLHFASDMQKWMALKYNSGKLITEGLWGVVRNPNYLGELLIYCGFGLLPFHWAPMAVMAFSIVVIWVPNMVRKDKSLSRYPEFAQYKAQTKLIVPYLI